MPITNVHHRMYVYLIAGLIGLGYGMYGRYQASIMQIEVLRKADTIHSQAATIIEMRKTNIVLQNCSGINSDRITRLYNDIADLKAWKDTLTLFKIK